MLQLKLRDSLVRARVALINITGRLNLTH
jgi:hypothetical protein